MRQKKGVTFAAVLVLLVLAWGIGFWIGNKGSSPDNEDMIRSGNISQITIGSSPIEEYTIYHDLKSGAAASELRQLIYGACGTELDISLGSTVEKGISVKVNGENAIHIQDGNIEICGKDKASCMENVRIFANMYLGYAFVGESRQHILTTNSILTIPETVQEYEDVWMKEREPIICLWKTNVARGTYPDMNVSLKSELLSFSDDQLYEYVKMMKYCGFTGIQVTDMCSAWAQYGGYEFVQDRIRYMADAAHSLGMKFTLWVWGAEFEGYGWVDHSVVFYTDPTIPSRELPAAIETFEKYYSIYAQLADCSDRIIMHFNDPGKLHTSQDIGYFANMFREKCLAVNQELDFGVSCYTYDINIHDLAEYMGTDITLYGSIIHQDSDFLPCRDFRVWARDIGFRYGVWSWNLTEMEIDQLAEMNVNARLLADCYQRTSQVDNIYCPEYWSEMDSYHMINLFSLYCSGQLLQNPYLDPDQLLHRIAEAVVGEKYADDFFEVLSIVQDARTGNDWTEFRVGLENYLLESSQYPAEQLLKRCGEAIPKLEEMIRAGLNQSSVPLAISTSDLLSMILPHLAQIRAFAEFRLLLEQLEKKYNAGASVSELQEMLDLNYRSIPEYNTVVGVWGQAEARAQYNLVKAFCGKTGLNVPIDPDFEYLRRQRLLGEMIIYQKSSEECVVFPRTVAPHWNLGYGEDSVVELVEDMLEEGLLTENADGTVFLTNWENYRYDF